MKSVSLLLILLVAFGLPAEEPARYDLILRGGRVVDGTGSPWYRADVAVKGDRIVAIAPRIGARAVREIAAEGLVVAPGFIDLHTH
ncbi:MAG TPA: D-aminoacylase, partial [Thermoanaerobaculia bacterium]|nr:D-aminoacylase [Thermoanaerobaculia bacterium]